MASPFNVKVVVVGDGAVGKTSLVSTWCNGTFPQDYVPTVFDNKTMEVDGQAVSIWDTAGQEEFDRLRALFYPDTDAFVLVFSAADVNSAYNIRDRWIPELNQYAPNIPFVLVASKTDLRTDPTALAALARQGTKPVQSQQGEALANEVGAARYFETSAKLGMGIAEPFQEAARLGASIRAQKKAGKTIKRPPPPAPSASPPARSSSHSSSPQPLFAGNNAKKNSSSSCCTIV